MPTAGGPKGLYLHMSLATPLKGPVSPYLAGTTWRRTGASLPGAWNVDAHIPAGFRAKGLGFRVPD